VYTANKSQNWCPSNQLTTKMPSDKACTSVEGVWPEKFPIDLLAGLKVFTCSIAKISVIHKNNAFT